MSRPKLFLLDAMALIYRAHFSFAKNPRITSYGLNTSASFGFTNTILDVMQREKPTHMAVLFDSETPTHRHDKMESYKGTRQEVPEDLVKNLPFIRCMLDAMQIAHLQLDGYEADDLIGRLAIDQSALGMDVYIMSSDKDLAQLVRPGIWMYKPAFMGNPPQILDSEGIYASYGVRPEQIPDFLGLKGDSVDNIPGVPKIGDKTALELLATYGTLENVLENAEKIEKKSIRETLITHAEQGRFSKELATLHPDVPIEYDAEKLLLRPADRELLEPLLAELEFKNLASRLLGNLERPKAAKPAGDDLFSAPSSPKPAEKPEVQPVALVTNTASDLKTLEDTPHTYETIEGAAAIQKLVNELLKFPSVCFDTETTSLEPLLAEVVGVSLSAELGKAYYIPIPPNREEAQVLLDLFRPLLSNPAILKIGQNIKYDMHIMANYGITVVGPYFDTMLAHYVVDSSAKHSMDLLAKKYLNYKPIPISELIGKKGVNQGNMRDVELEKISIYASEDADVTLKLHEPLVKELAESNLSNVLNDIDQPLMSVLFDMERVGIKLDSQFLTEYSKEIENEMRQIEEDIYRLSGERFNIASPKQLGEILFTKLKLVDKPKKTATGQYSTDEDTLQMLAFNHDLPARILDYRSYSKLKSTYVDSLPLLVNPNTGRLHTTYNQTVAVTGRLSSNNPNLQNIPIRTDKGREVRKAFISPDADHVLLSADYSQIELRIMAAMSQDEAMLGSFLAGQDIHTTTAAKVFSVDTTEVTGEMRRKAKMVNFGIIYGITPFGLSQRLRIPRAEAKDIIDNYFVQFPAVKAFMNTCIERAREHGYASTLHGRRHHLPDIHSANMTVRQFAERNAINTPVQGTAADLIKLAMIRLQQELRTQKLETQLLLQVHDELLLEVPTDELSAVQTLVRNCMENAMQLGVRLEVNLGVGQNWLDAH
jgi:DNA polymerase I